MRRVDGDGRYKTPTLRKGKADCKMCWRRMDKLEPGRLMRWCHTCKRMVDIGEADMTVFHVKPIPETRGGRYNTYGQWVPE